MNVLENLASYLNSFHSKVHPCPEIRLIIMYLHCALFKLIWAILLQNKRHAILEFLIVQTEVYERTKV